MAKTTKVTAAQVKAAPVMRKNYSNDAAGSTQYQADLKAANKATVAHGKQYFKASKKSSLSSKKAASPTSKAKPMNSCVKK
jgi:uncharacterized protein YegP (UPF0339 family)